MPSPAAIDTDHEAQAPSLKDRQLPVPFANLYDDVKDPSIDKKIDQKLNNKKKKEKAQKTKSVLADTDSKTSSVTLTAEDKSANSTQV